MAHWNNVTVLSRNAPNENEQRALGGFLTEANVDPSTYEFIQTEVPLGLQRVANAFDIEVDSDRLPTELFDKQNSGKAIGFPTSKDISRKHGFGKQAYTSSADIIMVRDTTIDVFEVKTRNERIEGVSDIHKPFGQLIMYLDRFGEDFPTLTEKYTLRGAILAEDSELDIELLEPSFLNRNIGYFDPRRGGFLLQMGPVSVSTGGEN